MFNKLRLLTPGPTPLPDNVRLSLAVDMIHHRKPEFEKIMGELRIKLKHLFETEEEVISLTASGTGAMVGAISSLFNPKEKVLVIDAGSFGGRWVKIAKAQALNPVVLRVNRGESIGLNRIKEALAEHSDLKGLCIQLCETSTGVQFPIKEIGELLAKSNILFIVDGISGVGLCPCPMDKWHIDCLLTGSQKGLMLPPGLSFIALSKKALAKAQEVEQPNFYFNILEEHKAVLKNQSCFTPAIGLLVALNESLNYFAGESLQAAHKKQWALSQMTRGGVKALGLELFAPTAPAWGLTSIKMPEGISSSTILNNCSERFNVVMAAGQEELKESIIRFGHMGWIDWADIAAGLHALAESFIAAGFKIKNADYLEQALAAYHQALHKGYPEI